LIVPLIVLSGILAPVPNSVSQIASTRWAFQSIIGITGMGSDVAADPCWQLDEKLRDAMDLDTKDKFQCKCMGTQVFNQDSCNFPGTGDYYVAEINQMSPIEPAALPEQPPKPVMPPQPNPPADKTDPVQTVQFLNAVDSYMKLANTIQDDYTAKMGLYQVEADVYKSKMIKYQEDLAKFQVARISAVNTAEGNIKGILDKYGWAFVDKSDPKIYFPWLFQTWISQLEIVAAYFVIILVLIKRKDVK
jgi:ABC transport system ATP-binding/permease protein